MFKFRDEKFFNEKFFVDFFDKICKNNFLRNCSDIININESDEKKKKFKDFLKKQNNYENIDDFEKISNFLDLFETIKKKNDVLSVVLNNVYEYIIETSYCNLNDDNFKEF